MHYFPPPITTWYKCAQQVGQYFPYKTIANDTLSSIAKKYLNDVNKWKDLQTLNSIKDPNKLEIGQVINIPITAENYKLFDTLVAPQAEKKEEEKKPEPTIGDPWGALKAEIAKSEGNYGAYNRGKSYDTPSPTIDITKLTVGQVMEMQRKMGKDGKRLLFAVGKYQMIPKTLAECVSDSRVGVSSSDMFDGPTQEKLFMHLIYKRPNLMSYIDGKSDNIDAAVNDLAAEFASLPMTSGKGRYDRDKAGNKASGGLERVEKIKSILMSIRNKK
jgi:hypothetical protein